MSGQTMGFEPATFSGQHPASYATATFSITACSETATIELRCPVKTLGSDVGHLKRLFPNVS